MQERKEELIKEYNELTTQISELTQQRLRILGKLELIEELEEPKKEKK
tara:strand:+ start:503 stop:646 length:144 start_codon:yes stop_codon:yes gene_type:complete